NNEIKPSLHSSVKCNYCSKVFNRAVPLRMQTHLNECLNVSSNAKLQKTILIQNPIPSNITEHPLTNTNTPPQALYSAGVLFTFVDNPFVIQFFKYLRSSFKLSNRKKIANELLNEVYEDSNINRDSVHNFVICIPKPSFFDTTFSGEESYTAEWIADQIIQQMDII
ncbi:14154_t:CDS:2, partial [Funneliformis caledonium]